MTSSCKLPIIYKNFYQSKPDRLDNVIQMKGHLTKY